MSPTLSDRSTKQQRLRVGQSDKFTSQRSHQHPAEIGRGIKAEKGSGVYNPTSQSSHQHPAEIGKGIKAESRGGAIGQPPKTGQEVDPGADLWDRGQYSKLNFPTLLGELLTKQSCS
jgi:hypothetical protein